MYKYAKKREIKRVYAIKGSNQTGSPLISRPSTNNKLKVKLFMVGVDTAKELIYSRLQIEEWGDGYMHFNETYDEEYFKQLTAETIKKTYSKGYEKRVWVKIRQRNEALDYTVYNLAALAILNPNFKMIKQKILSQKTTTTTKNIKKIKTSKLRGFAKWV